MAPSAMDIDGFVSLEDIKPPPGVVLPPKEIKGARRRISPSRKTSANHGSLLAILEKTAGYVARNGFVFEGTVDTPLPRFCKIV